MENLDIPLKNIGPHAISMDKTAKGRQSEPKKRADTHTKCSTARKPHMFCEQENNKTEVAMTTAKQQNSETANTNTAKVHDSKVKKVQSDEMLKHK